MSKKERSHKLQSMGRKPVVEKLEDRWLLSCNVANVSNADFNSSGLVDGADLTIWEGGFGSTSNSTVDFNASGAVDGVDMGIWRAGFGLTGSATPSQGDSDGDSDVDGADFLAMQRGFGPVVLVTQSQGDADADGDVDGADFLAWQRNYWSARTGGIDGYRVHRHFDRRS